MKKQQYTKPATSIVESYMERVMTTVSHTKGESPDGKDTDVPGWGGEGDGSDEDMNGAKKNNAWSSWDE